MIRLRVPGTLKYRSVAVRVVTEACRLAQGRDAEQGGDKFEDDVVSAFGEAFNNVAFHSYASGDAGHVDIEIDWTDEELVIQMTDTGQSFDPDTIEPPDLDSLPEGGMGLFIIRECMDEVTYRAGPPNVLRLTKRRGSDSERGSDDERGPDDFPPFSGPSFQAAGVQAAGGRSHVELLGRLANERCGGHRESGVLHMGQRGYGAR